MEKDLKKLIFGFFTKSPQNYDFLVCWGSLNWALPFLCSKISILINIWWRNFKRKERKGKKNDRTKGFEREPREAYCEKQNWKNKCGLLGKGVHWKEAKSSHFIGAINGVMAARKENTSQTIIYLFILYSHHIYYT